MKDDSTIGSRLRTLRKTKAVSQVEAADEIGIARPTLAGYERDHDPPGRENAVKIAAYYEVSVDFILGRTDDPKMAPGRKPRHFASAAITSSSPAVAETVEDPDELALLNFWRDLNDEGKAIMAATLDARMAGRKAG